MADTKITQLPSLVTLTDAAVLVVIDDDNMSRLPVSSLGDLFLRRDLFDQPDGVPQLDENADLVGPIVPQANITGALDVVANEIAFESDTQTLLLGDVRYAREHLGGLDSKFVKPPNGLVLATSKASGNVTVYGLASSGSVAVDWWDGTRATAATWAGISKAAADNRFKVCRVYPVDAGSVLERFAGYSNELTFLDVSGCSSLESLNVTAGSLTKLNISDCVLLTSLDCSYNDLTSLDLSGLTALTTFLCNDNQLTSVRALGVAPTEYHHLGYPAVNIGNNLLSAAALNKFFEDLAENVTGNPIILAVYGNPGLEEPEYDATIATAKGYVVIEENFWA